VVAAEELFFYAEFPFFRGDVTLSGRSSFHPPPLLRLARQALVPQPPPPERRSQLVLMQRPPPPWGCSLLNHAELLAALTAAFPTTPIVIHRGDEGLLGQRDLFSSAAAVVGQHGAGFANLVFCAPRTSVVEIGWASFPSPPPAPAPGEEAARSASEPRPQGEGEEEAEWMSDMFAELATALGLHYWLVLAASGHQTSPLWVDPALVVQALQGLGGPPVSLPPEPAPSP